MSSVRFWLCGAAVASTLSLVSAGGCGTGGVQPCHGTQCAPLEGRYALHFDSGEFQESTGNCDALPVALPKELTLTRVGSRLTGTLDLGQTLNGTLYDNHDFTLAGTAPTTPGSDFSDNINTVFGGVYEGPGTPSSGVGDGGISGDGGTVTVDGGANQLSGLFTRTRTRSSGSGGSSERCQLTRLFTATRLP